MLIRSKLGHYEAELTNTQDGVKVVLWFCYQDGNMRKHLSTDIFDVPFHFACDSIHKLIWNQVPEVAIQGEGKRSPVV